jgi:hypothetical protein
MLLATLALLVGCPTDADDDSFNGDDDDVDAGTITVRGFVHDLGEVDSTVSGVSVVVANPAPMLANGGEPAALGVGTVAGDGSFEVTDIDPTGAEMGLIMIVDDNGAEYLSVATGIHADEYAGWTDGFVVEDQVAFAASAEWVAAMDLDLAIAGWHGELFEGGALIGFVQDAAMEPVDGATVTSTEDQEVFYADGDPPGEGSFVDATTTPNAATSADAEALWIAPGGGVDNWSAAADGYTYDPILVGSTEEILVVIAFRPAE